MTMKNPTCPSIAPRNGDMNREPIKLEVELTVALLVPSETTSGFECYQSVTGIIILTKIDAS